MQLARNKPGWRGAAECDRAVCAPYSAERDPHCKIREEMKTDPGLGTVMLMGDGHTDDGR